RLPLRRIAEPRVGSVFSRPRRSRTSGPRGSGGPNPSEWRVDFRSGHSTSMEAVTGPTILIHWNGATTMPKITPFLWYDNQAEQAANFYVSIFPNSRVKEVTRYGDGGPVPSGTVMTVTFELDGQEFIALNGGPHFRFNEAVSFSIDCGSQEEVDYYWDSLTDGGEEGECGWLKDRYGLSWQVNP